MWDAIQTGSQKVLAILWKPFRSAHAKRASEAHDTVLHDCAQLFSFARPRRFGEANKPHNKFVIFESRFCYVHKKSDPLLLIVPLTFKSKRRAEQNQNQSKPI
jgi:hypothetical protein